MKNTQKIRWFVSGLLTAALAANLLSPALAALTGKTIEVFTGVNIYIDDVKLDPQDANGNPVEAFVYNGTTYLPVRAVGEAVGKTVQWEGKTNSVYLGKHTGDKPAVWLKDLDYFTGSAWKDYYYTETHKDNLGNTRENIIRAPSYASGTYKINGQYSKLTGTFFQLYDDRSINNETDLKILGDGEELFSATMNSGIEPIDFSVDLRGVLELKVSLNGSRAAIADCGLWT